MARTLYRYFKRLSFPRTAYRREKIAARCRFLGQFFIATRAVVADGRGVHQRRRLSRGGIDCGHNAPRGEIRL
jgi:hypothetical protein